MVHLCGNSKFSALVVHVVEGRDRDCMIWTHECVHACDRMRSTLADGLVLTWFQW